jgi:phenylacetate-coenzyme A ligase PaaK-like adenylate-forming protein
MSNTLGEFQDFLNLQPYSMAENEKEDALFNALRSLTEHHYNNCIKYRRILDSIGFQLKEAGNLYDLPFLPSRLFKEVELMSVPLNTITKSMTSSGTTGQGVSKIFLDRDTSVNQTKILVKILSYYLGSSRLPMLVIDSPSTVENRFEFSARTAGIQGFTTFSNERVFALNEDLSINISAVRKFLAQNSQGKFLIFGFTFMIWEYFLNSINNENLTPDFSNGILFHGGGWKKLTNLNISNDMFKDILNVKTGVVEVHDYYGMIEQTGSIFVECSDGYLHAPIYSDIVTRSPFDFKPLGIGETGIVQVVSIVAGSYPGHIILTEDEGTIYGVDDCKCGKLGKYFKVHGRIKNAEIRGCSDTFRT